MVFHSSVGKFAQNLVHHGEGKLAVNPSNGLIKLENVLSDSNIINRQAENSVFPKISGTTSMGKTSHSSNHTFKCNNIKYRETGISAIRSNHTFKCNNIKYRETGISAICSNMSLAHTFQSYLTLLASHFAVRIHSVRFYVLTYSFYPHDNPNSFNFVRDKPQATRSFNMFTFLLHTWAG